ncbi:hypothetical protein DSM112329_04409 [Paraconexibacter sp. AEG42_29]|uniref:Hypervirulence associated protein TUDOR domain-containing protein n=1 Tax=Paraconexibacter sp. AEG42_29 TaxID=2997339 RepID=A0AAU7B0K0_9ACTN
MSNAFTKGDKVSWKTSQGTTHGKVVKKLTSDCKIDDHQVRASTDDPQYLVESDKTGAHAAHKPDALTKAS